MNNFKFTMWTYPPLSQFTPDEVDVWADCGMTVPMAPKTFYDKDEPEALIPFLDRAQQRGIKLLAYYDDLGFDKVPVLGAGEYERRLREIIDVIGSHPALYGFVVGDEPGTPEEYEASRDCIAIHKKVAPHLEPMLNYSGTMAETAKENLGGRTPAEWAQYANGDLGLHDLVYDEYSQQVNNGGGKDQFFKTMKIMVDAAEKAGCDCWTNLLSSEHLVFHAPNEKEVRWQVHMAAVCGCRGVVWFRFYDRDIAIDAINSPIDEFGNKTEQFYAILRTQRRFLNNYAQLADMKRKSTYTAGLDRGVYPVFTENDHDLIKKVDSLDEAVFSFFEDEKGREFLCLVNGDLDHYSVIRLHFDRDRCRVFNVTLNGSKEMELCYSPSGSEPDITLYPAQLALLRIERK